MRRGGLRAALTGYRLLPRPLRRVAVRTVTPHFTVGCVLVLSDMDDRVLLLRQRHYGDELTLPGGLLHRRETPLDGIRREVEEEVGILAEVRLPATVVVEPAARRVDVVYAARFLGNPDAVRPDRQEAVEVCWRPAAEVLASASESGDAALVSTATWVVLQQWALAPDGACGTARLAAALR